MVIRINDRKEDKTLIKTVSKDDDRRYSKKKKTRVKYRINK